MTDAKSQIDSQPAQGLEPRATFEARLAAMLREGLANRAALLFVQRALGPMATPRDCAELLHRIAMGSGGHPPMAWLAGRESDGFPITAETLARFCEAIGAEGSALLSSQTDQQARDHARAVLGAAYEIQAAVLAPAKCLSWRKDRVLRPWFEALAGALPAAVAIPGPAPGVLPGSAAPAAVSPWPMREPSPLMDLARLLGNRTLTYPVLQAALMAGAPPAVLAEPSLAWGGNALLVLHKTAETALIGHTLAWVRHYHDAGVSPLQVIALLRASLDGAEAIGAPANGGESHGLSDSVDAATKALEPIIEKQRHLGAVFDVFYQLRGPFPRPPLYKSSLILAGFQRPPHRSMLDGMEMWAWRDETMAWFRGAIPELRAKDIIREREGLIAQLNPSPRPDAGLELSPEEEQQARSDAEALRYKRGFAITGFYCAYVEAVKPALQHLRGLRGPGQPVGLRQLGEPLLIPRLAMHTGVVRHEIDWLRTYADRHPELAQDVTTARAGLDTLARDMVAAIGDTSAWPAWVGESMRLTEGTARAQASSVAVPAPATASGLIPPGGLGVGPTAAAAPSPEMAPRPSDSLASPAHK